jgi:L-fuconate dehydratase
MRIVDVVVRDLRFPTSASRAGSDAMHRDPDYSAAYVVLHTDDTAFEGHGLTFTIGRGNELCVAAIKALAPMVIGCRLESLARDLSSFWYRLTGDSQLRWVGPEKGVIHLATAALVNAVWDLYARTEGKPLWKLLVDLTPEQLVSAIPFDYISEVLDPREAIEMLTRQMSTKEARQGEILERGYPAYTTSAGWLGYSDSETRRHLREAKAQGWTHFKMKVGGNLDEDIRRATLVREEIGWDCKLMMDANQVWSVPQAIEHMTELSRFSPHWIEEPTSPDDILGHATIAKAIAPIGVATGEHCANRVVFKQLMQAGAISFCQIDCCRLGGISEALAVILMAAKFGIPICPHAGGVGLCEYAQHLSIFDYISVSGSLEDRVIEYVDNLHEHFADPVIIRDARYVAPQAPGTSITILPETLTDYQFPGGAIWADQQTDDEKCSEPMGVVRS